jgi:hypothetical protein
VLYDAMFVVRGRCVFSKTLRGGWKARGISEIVNLNYLNSGYLLRKAMAKICRKGDVSTVSSQGLNIGRIES